MILTVTLNPCIDRTLTVSNFREGGTTPVSATRTEIGGKGLNVSRALKNLGASTLCLGFSHEKGGSDLRSPWMSPPSPMTWKKSQENSA